MSLIRSATVAGLTVQNACYKILSLVYKEITRTATITVGIFSNLELSQIHNYPPLEILNFQIPEWQKDTPGNTFEVAYQWLVTQPELAGAVSDEAWLAAQVAEEEIVVEEEQQDGYIN